MVNVSSLQRWAMNDSHGNHEANVIAKWMPARTRVLRASSYMPLTAPLNAISCFQFNRILPNNISKCWLSLCRQSVQVQRDWCNSCDGQGRWSVECCVSSASILHCIHRISCSGWRSSAQPHRPRCTRYRSDIFTMFALHLVTLELVCSALRRFHPWTHWGMTYLFLHIHSYPDPIPPRCLSPVVCQFSASVLQDHQSQVTAQHLVMPTTRQTDWCSSYIYTRCLFLKLCTEKPDSSWTFTGPDGRYVRNEVHASGRHGFLVEYTPQVAGQLQQLTVLSAFDDNYIHTYIRTLLKWWQNASSWQ